MEHLCQRCGKPCDERNFITLPSGRIWMHVECILEGAKEVIESGRLDDDRAAIKWPDGNTEIMSGKKPTQQNG
jgi:hypothetical protein